MPVKKEVRFIINPLRQQQEEAAMDQMMKPEAVDNDDDEDDEYEQTDRSRHRKQQQQFLSSGSAIPPVVFTARIPLPLTVRCCASLRHLADMLGDFAQQHSARRGNPFTASAAAWPQKKNNDDNDDDDDGDENENDDAEEEQQRRQREIQRQAIALGATGFLTGGNPTASGAAATSASFLSEMPSVLPLELPFSACSSCDALRLFCEWHAGCDYSRMEVCEVTGWGTAQEVAVPVAGNTSSSSSSSLAAASAAASAASSRSGRYGVGAAAAFTGKKSKVDPRLRYVHAFDNVTSSSSDDDDDDNDEVHVDSQQQQQQQQQGKRSIYGGMNTRIEHATLSALALQDRNPAVIFAPPPTGILPRWERQWVLDNFLTLDSPGCCAKAAKVAVLAEFMGCTPLIELMACIIASRLCERHNPSTDHMQWCLSGNMSGFA